MPATRRFALHPYGFELVDAVARLGTRFDDSDADREIARPDLDQVARLARTAQRSAIDFFVVDDALGGISPQSGRRRPGAGPLRLATRLAPASGNITLVPRVRATAVEPEKLLDGLVAVELASIGRRAWQLDLSPNPASAKRSAELLAAVVTDAYGKTPPRTQVGSLARARRARGIREGSAAGLRGRNARPSRDGCAAEPVSPLLVVGAATAEEVDLAIHWADIVRLTVADMVSAVAVRARLRDGARAAGRRAGREPQVLVDLPVCIGENVTNAEARCGIVESMTGRPLGEGVVWTGTAAGLAEMVHTWIAAGACDGFVFQPTSLPADLLAIIDQVMPLLQAYGVARKATAARASGARKSRESSSAHATAEPRVIGRARTSRSLPTQRPARAPAPARNS